MQSCNRVDADSRKYIYIYIEEDLGPDQRRSFEETKRAAICLRIFKKEDNKKRIIKWNYL